MDGGITVSVDPDAESTGEKPKWDYGDKPSPWKDLVATPKGQAASTDKKLEAFNEWTRRFDAWITTQPDYSPAMRERYTQKIREARSGIESERSVGEKAKAFGGSMVDSFKGMVGGAALGAGEAATDIADTGSSFDRIVGERTVQILDRLDTDIDNRFVTPESDPELFKSLEESGFEINQTKGIENAGEFTVPGRSQIDRRQKLDGKLAEFKTAIDNGQHPEGAEFIDWLKQQNREIVNEARAYNNEEPLPTDRSMSENESSRLFDENPELAAMLLDYRRTRDDSMFAEITKRIAETDTRKETDASISIEKEDPGGVVGVAKKLLSDENFEIVTDAGTNPVEAASNIASMLLTGGTATAAAKGTFKAAAKRFATNTAIDVPNEAATEGFQTFVEDSRGDVLGSMKQGALMALAFQASGGAVGGGAKQLAKVSNAITPDVAGTSTLGQEYSAETTFDVREQEAAMREVTGELPIRNDDPSRTVDPAAPDTGVEAAAMAAPETSGAVEGVAQTTAPVVADNAQVSPEAQTGPIAESDTSVAGSDIIAEQNLAGTAVDRTIDPNQDTLGFATMPNQQALESEIGRAELGAPPAPTDSQIAKRLYEASSIMVENGSLPRGMRELIKQADYRNSGYESMFTELGNSLGRKIQERAKVSENGGFDIEQARLSGLSYQALRGDDAALNALPSDIKQEVESGRRSIDLFSERLIDDGVVSDELADTVGNNLGQYILREFRVFDPAQNWNYETIRRDHPEVYDAALKEVTKEGKLSKDEADNAIREMTDPTRAQGFYMGSGKAGKIDVTSFIKRKDLSQPILDLLGEVRDPAANLRNTGTKTAKIWANHASQVAMREFLLANNLASTERSKAEGRNWNRIGEESNFGQTRTKKNMPGFGELYAPPELASAIDGYFETSQGKESAFSFLGKVLATATGTGKFAQVILNPAAYPTNMAGAFWTEVFNGRLSVTGANKFAHTFKDIAKKDPKKFTIQEQRELYNQSGEQFMEKGGISTIRYEAFKNEMALRGIRDNSVFAEDMNQSFERGFGPDKMRRYYEGAGKLYQVPDNAAKANAFSYELEKWSKAEPTKPLNELMDLAAADVRATTQNYDRVPRTLKRFSQYGVLVPTYISFSWELARNSFNTAKIAAREIRSGNPVLQRAGYQRIAGMMVVGAALASLNAMNGGADEEEEDAINRSFKPPWLEGKSVMVLKSGGGKVRYADPAYLIPHQFFYNPISNAFNSDEGVDSIAGVFKNFSDGFDQLNIATQVASELIANKKVGGGPIWNEEIAKDDWAYKKREQLRHVTDSMYTPGFLRTMDKIRKANKNEIGYMGNTATWDDIAAQTIGLRPYTVDVKRATKDRLSEFATRYREAASFMSEGRAESMTEEEAADRQGKEDAAVERLRVELKQFVEDARTLGVSRFEISEMMKSASMPKKIRP